MKILILCLILSSLNYYKTSQVKTVYVIPHSHDDVGWIRTIDSYYYGVDKDKKNVGVKYILNSIYRELQLNEDFKFIYSEMAFFTKWWNEQTSLTKENVKKLVKQRRLQFVGGGYVMNDEATTYYSDIIDQMTLGHEFIKNTFGVEAVPTIAWQIDPFGHSVSIPKYFEMLLSQQNIIDFLWKSKVSNQSIITHYLTEKYSQPSELDFFVKAPIVDDPKSDLYNLDTKLEYFIKHCDLLLQKTNLAKSPFPFGDDFKYENANIIAENIIKLVKYGNEQFFTLFIECPPYDTD
ncbi:hypothetical protein A3Q56_02473 [Intoshia linei]|uniref:Glycoside hydrolase family 38 N-terminal domain-containing protein n=1 Tax=Intoshia linei TaxID=1819745 RepID=A0A177B8M0_9BILA|nr:hypothetical protein A3Q56_02473 [Intoshia linei]